MLIVFSEVWEKLNNPNFKSLEFEEVGMLHEPFQDFGDTLSENGLNIRSLMRRFKDYYAIEIQ